MSQSPARAPWRARLQRAALQLALALALPLAVAACGGSSGGGSGSADDALTVANIGAPVSFNPQKSDVGNYLQYLQPVYDTLVRIEPDGSLRPSLATGWRYLDGRRTLELRLRDDVTFSDGTRFDAAAVKANLDHGKRTAGPRTSALAPVKDVEVVNPRTVRIHLSEPAPSLLFDLGQVMGMMVSPRALAAPDLDRTPVGSGPYLLDRRATVDGDRYVYERNPKYWDARAFPFRSIEIRVITDPTARLNALRSGQVDAGLGDVTTLDAAESAGLTVLRTPVDWRGLILEDRDGRLLRPLGDVRVRQALNYAIDRRAMVAGVAKGLGYVSTQVFPRESDAYVPALDERYPYDPAKARRLLADAGYPNGFTFTAPAMPAALLPDMQVFQRYFAAIGVKMNLKAITPAEFVPSALSGKNPVVWMSFGPQGPAQTASLLLLPNSQWNPFRAVDPEMVSLTERAAAADGEQAAQLYRRLSERVIDQAWFVVSYIVDQLYYVDEDKVRGVEMWQQQAVPSIYGWKPAS